MFSWNKRPKINQGSFSVPKMWLQHTQKNESHLEKIITEGRLIWGLFGLNNLYTILNKVYLPKCWATSKTSLVSRPCTSRAFRMGGRPSSNWTSTTAPMTATMRPVAAPAFGEGDVWAT